MLACERAWVIPTGVVQVLNNRANTVHLYTAGKSTVCKAWTSGSSAEPVASARFATSSSFYGGLDAMAGFCTSCYSSAGMTKVGAVPINVDPPPPSALDSSSSSASSSSSDE